jgi:glycosyltransferase involved in cell wall biosynthesis
MQSVDVSVVIPAHNEGENLVDTVACVLENAAPLRVEVIVAADDCTDGSAQRVAKRHARDRRVRVVTGSGLGIAGARNRGAREARGDALVFLDGHCYVPSGALEALTTPLDDPAVGMTGPAIANLWAPDAPPGCGATWGSAQLDMQWLPVQGADPYPVPLLPGGCQALRRLEFETLGGYDSGMGRWGSEDFELSLRVWLMGKDVLAAPQAVIYHVFREKSAYTVDYAQVTYNRLRLAVQHFKEERCAGVFDCHQGWPGFSAAILKLMHDDALERRKRFFADRRRDDDWLAARFGIPI